MDEELVKNLAGSGVIIALIGALRIIALRLLPPPKAPIKQPEAIATVAPAFLPDYERIIKELREHNLYLTRQLVSLQERIEELQQESKGTGDDD